MKLRHVNLPYTRSMTELTESRFDPARRNMIKAGMAASLALLWGCTPLKIVFKAYPKDFKNDDELVRNCLSAFVETIIPGVEDSKDKGLMVFYDDYFPLAKYRGYFVYDLCHRAQSIFREISFISLNDIQRTSIVEEGEKDNKVTGKLYRGAILLTQIAFFSGIYDSAEGCSLIGFPGSNYGYQPSEIYYENIECYLAEELTLDGNYL